MFLSSELFAGQILCLHAFQLPPCLLVADFISNLDLGDKDKYREGPSFLIPQAAAPRFPDRSPAWPPTGCDNPGARGLLLTTFSVER